MLSRPGDPTGRAGRITSDPDPAENGLSIRSRFKWGLRKYPAAVGLLTSWPEVPIRESVLPVTVFDGGFL